MATSDGISTEDWDKVHELALDIANASLRAEKGEEVKGVVEAYKMELLNHLDSLARKYGSLPTILATRADYIDDTADKIRLFNEAYTSAKTHGDIHNKLAVASSLARLYIEDLQQPHEGKKWLEVFGECLKKIGDDSDMEEYEELQESLKLLERK